MTNEKISDNFSDREFDELTENLLNKEGMNEEDKERMQQVIEQLEATNQLNEKNIKKLEAIKYAPEYIEIGGIKLDRKKFKPDVEFDDQPYEENPYAYAGKEKGVFKQIYE
jgi:hypothetical protein